jgi:hypothetical protein
MYEQLNNKLVQQGGLLLVLAQLKKTEDGRIGNFYAESMTEFFGSVVAKLVYPYKDGNYDNLNPYLTTIKIRDSKVGKTYLDIPLVYDTESKTLELKK